MIVYISIGNSDDKLTQDEWAQFVLKMQLEVVVFGQIHGEWFSLPNRPYQNACWCIEFPNPRNMQYAREAATKIRTRYRQDSIAWARADTTEFI